MELLFVKKKQSKFTYTRIMGFKENLKDEISYQGILVKELAIKAGLQPSSISNYIRENSSVPSADIAVKIAQALGVSVEYLVTGKNSSAPKFYALPQKQRKILDTISSFDDTDLDAIIALANALKKRYSNSAKTKQK